MQVDNELKFEQHIELQCAKANKILCIIRRSFEYLDKDMLRKLYTALIRPLLEYGHEITYPRFNKAATLLEGVQKRATKMIPELKNIPYEERLKTMNLQSLYYRRDRGDMMEVYKLSQGLYNVVSILTPESDHTRRGHAYKLKLPRTYKDVRQKFFSVRSVSKWNSLPDTVVTAETIESFKTCLDKHWKNHTQNLTPVMPLPPCNRDT